MGYKHTLTNKTTQHHKLKGEEKPNGFLGIPKSADFPMHLRTVNATKRNIALQQSITNWDGKSAVQIGAIYDKTHHKRGFIADIIALIEDDRLQVGATWLLKRHLQNDKRLNARAEAKIFSLLSGLKQWEAQLHILQCIPFMTIADETKKPLETFLKNCLTTTNKLVRAWAYNGFSELAKQHPENRPKVSAMLEAALAGNEAPSVKARIRQILLVK